jgi:hypothetical protein
MIFYTRQSIEKWNNAKELGYLEGEKEYVRSDKFNKAYC